MQYTKPPLSFEAQADQLIQRGLIADRALLVKRLSAYLYPFRAANDGFSEVQLEPMGLPVDWREHPLWNTP